VLAAAEAHGATWADALAAVDVGNAVVRAITETLPSDDHYGRGWHTTSTVGRIAAVAALTRLLALDEGAARHALGIVASTAAGSRAAFGTTTTPLHARLAALDAVVAVGMALAGVDADPDQLDHPMGFLAQYGVGGPRPDFSARLEHWASTWPELVDQAVPVLLRHPLRRRRRAAGRSRAGTAPDVTAITVRVQLARCACCSPPSRRPAPRDAS
jgi:2-methylcitrate dehydratase PrpD